MNTTVETLKVPGASLYYEVRGAGPVLLLIPGGAADAGVYTGLAGLLAGRYTVVTCDQRGNSRSPLDGPGEDQRIEVHGDDAHRLLAALTGEPAFVFGNSGGALVGLELVARHPEQVRTLVAHEPPVMTLLPEADQARAFSRQMHDLYRRDGTAAAIQMFLSGTGLNAGSDRSGPPSEPSPEMQETMARIWRNWDFFFAHLIVPWTAYVPDVAAIRAASTRTVVAGGSASRGQMAYRAAAALAERLGTDLVEFPGDHGGFAGEPGAFAEKLDLVLSDAGAELRSREKS